MKALDSSDEQQAAVGELKQQIRGSLTHGSVPVHVCKSTSKSLPRSAQDLVRKQAMQKHILNIVAEIILLKGKVTVTAVLR